MSSDIRPGESVDDFLSRVTDEVLARHGLLTPTPTPEADSLEKIHADFPDLFGKPKAGS